MHIYLDCKFMRLYQTLSEADKTHLTKWFRYELKGEGGEKTTKLWQLYTLMTKPVSDKEIIWKKLYGTDNYDNRRLNNLLSKLYEKLEDFILIQEYKNRKVENSLMMTDYLLRHSLSDDCESELRKADGLIREIPYKNEYYFKLAAQYGVAMQKFTILYEPDLKRNYSPQIYDNTEILMAIRYLQNVCTYISNKHQSEGIFSETQRNYFIERLKQIPTIPENPIFSLYLNLYLLLSKNALTPENILKLRNDLETNRSLIEQKEAIDIFRILLNQSLNLLRANHSKNIYRFNWELYVWGLEMELLQIHGKIPVTNLRNMFIIGSNAHSIEYIDRFFTENKIESAEKTDAIYSVRYYELFEKADYHGILQLYSKEHYPFRNLYFEFDVLSYYFRASYMLNHGSSLKNKCQYRINQLAGWEKEKKYPELYKFKTEFLLLLSLLKKDKESLLIQKQDLAKNTLFQSRWWAERIAEVLDESQ